MCRIQVSIWSPVSKIHLLGLWFIIHAQGCISELTGLRRCLLIRDHRRTTRLMGRAVTTTQCADWQIIMSSWIINCMQVYKWIFVSDDHNIFPIAYNILGDTFLLIFPGTQPTRFVLISSSFNLWQTRHRNMLLSEPVKNNSNHLFACITAKQDESHMISSNPWGACWCQGVKPCTKSTSVGSGLPTIHANARSANGAAGVYHLSSSSPTLNPGLTFHTHLIRFFVTPI